MRVDELRSREDFGAVLASTLATGWSEQFGREIAVSPCAVPGAQEWRVQPLLSIVFSPPLGARARRFAADSFRYTPVRWRAVPQWLLGTALASKAALPRVSSPLLWVTPAIEHAGELVVLPGNRRVRVFDLAAKRCRVLLKAGYEPESMKREISVRGGDHSGPFPPIVAHDPASQWFEEPMVPGFALPRCPRAKDRARYEQQAFHALTGWLDATSFTVSAAEHPAHLAARVREREPHLAQKAGASFARRSTLMAETLAPLAADLGTIQLGTTHGDFQPGNILVDRSAGEVLLTDWEHSETRFRDYDALVYGLGSRFAAGLPARVHRFLRDGWLGAAAALVPDARDAGWRRPALALFLLEELDWIGVDAVHAPGHEPSAPAKAVLALAEEVAGRVSPLD